jgi:hypothetical protein
MTDDTIQLDQHRGMSAQKATEARRRLKEIRAEQVSLRTRQEEFEKLLLLAPSANFRDVASKCHYLLELYARDCEVCDTRRLTAIKLVLEELETFSE